MPIHLPPISRRRFLAGSIAAGAGLFFNNSLLADEKPLDEHCWALFSDPHIAANRDVVSRSVNMTDNFKRVTREVIGLPKRPAGILVSGDCAFTSGELNDYATLTELLQPLRQSQMPIHLTVGNHDNRDHFWSALDEAKAAKRPLADHHVAIIETPRANWFVLDSLEQTLITAGVLGTTQLDWLRNSLDSHAEKPALVVTHHNPADAKELKGGLKDTAELLAIIRPRRQVKAYFFGHTHHWSAQEDGSGIHLINLPPTAYVFETGQPSGWVRADFSEDGARLELRCVDMAHPAHAQVKELKWRA